MTAGGSEFRRILRSGGWVVLLWNTRLKETTPFLRAYESLFETHGVDYAQVKHERIDETMLASFFGVGFQRRTLPNGQTLDYASLQGRLLSSSYTPTAGAPRSAPMLAALEKIFQENQRGGRVRMNYETQIYFGRG